MQSVTPAPGALPAAPIKGHRRSLAAFWLLGLLNNSGEHCVTLSLPGTKVPLEPWASALCLLSRALIAPKTLEQMSCDLFCSLTCNSSSSHQDAATPPEVKC